MEAVMKAPSERRMTAHHLLRAVILGGIAFYIVRLQIAGSLTLYIAPRMSGYVKLAAMALYVVAVVQVYQAYRSRIRRTDNCGCEHLPPRSFVRSLLVYGLFVLPLAAGFLSPDTMIGSAMAAQKGITLSTSQAIKEKESRTGGEAGTTASPAQTAAAKPGAPLTGEAKLKAMFPADEYTGAYAKYGIQLYQQPIVRVKEKDYMETLRHAWQNGIQRPADHGAEGGERDEHQACQRTVYLPGLQLRLMPQITISMRRASDSLYPPASPGHARYSRNTRTSCRIAANRTTGRPRAAPHTARPAPDRTSPLRSQPAYARFAAR
ncbi:DUF1980 domain-containing protein [Paenibacillus humicola]|uniref:DUF1980 domain-containing protein n=1 Tax=Paenibacillus humicola TaxID=3110540 RepID=UPI003084403A